MPCPWQSACSSQAVPPSTTRWELPDDTTTPRLAAALAAVGEGRADRAFELALDGFMAHARAPQAA
ncbi:hypothetical protein GCM10011579_074830 [Streptomyces albiflavescens]|uniref:Uncharacterized protein n=1 Tax=Streptomyces albiflavescens TaxID=1623582 RepID=A0A918D906_9ACTN|nr:hypothetical protein GCM10011579_074830 [Streptomyces albiflavescens]